jgi:glutamyl-Q tRNA(Asp) synthetase
MEDLDPPRVVPGAADHILATLAAFGMVSDEPLVYQSRREVAYQSAFDKLRQHAEIFPCWCSRADLDTKGGLHRGACIAAPDPARTPAWRVHVPARAVSFVDLLQGPQMQQLASEVGDFVIRRVEGWFAYQLAVIVDDAEAGITEVVRGCDLLDSTPRQIFLQQLLELPTPAYMHLPLVLDAKGRKLSKSDAARPVDASDPLPALRAALMFLGMHQAANEPAPHPEGLLALAAQHFDLADLRRTAARASAATCKD